MAAQLHGTSISALLFDKDGTLLSFQSTWGEWAVAIVRELSGGRPDLAEALADALDLDLQAAQFRPASIAIAGTERDVVDVLHPLLPDHSRDALTQFLADRAQGIDGVPAVPLGPLMGQFRAAGLALGVATNDGEAAARSQLERLQVADAFDVIFGYDSGHGAKPGPGPCLAFAAQVGVAPGSVIMVGDSLHDLMAGRAAGMRTVAVLTGVAVAEDLADHADLVLPDIGHLPAALGLPAQG